MRFPMDAAENLIDFVKYLNDIKATQGEQAWRNEIRSLAKHGLKAGGNNERFWRTVIKDFDWIDADALLREPDDYIESEVRKRKLPENASQAQCDAFLACVDALLIVAGSINNADPENEAIGRRLLDRSIEGFREATKITKTLQETPEAATSPAAEVFKHPPAERDEHQIQRELLGEIEAITDPDRLANWYDESKSRFKGVKTQKLRNEIFDAIRAKRIVLVEEISKKIGEIGLG